MKVYRVHFTDERGYDDFAFTADIYDEDIVNGNIVGLPSVVRAIGHCYASPRELEIPSQIRYIGKDAFANIVNLRKITFNEGLFRIEAGAFYRTQIEELILPQSLCYFHLSAVRGCDKLDSIKFGQEFSPSLVVELDESLPNLNLETNLEIMKYQPLAFTQLYGVWMEDKQFVDDCRDAILFGMLERDNFFGLTPERVRENAEICGAIEFHLDELDEFSENNRTFNVESKRNK